MTESELIKKMVDIKKEFPSLTEGEIMHIYLAFHPKDRAPRFDGETIRLLRLARRWSQGKLGDQVGLRQERISMFERGLKPTEAEKKRLLRVFRLGED